MVRWIVLLLFIIAPSVYGLGESPVCPTFVRQLLKPINAGLGFLIQKVEGLSPVDVLSRDARRKRDAQSILNEQERVMNAFREADAKWIELQAAREENISPAATAEKTVTARQQQVRMALVGYDQANSLAAKKMSVNERWQKIVTNVNSEKPEFSEKDRAADTQAVIFKYVELQIEGAAIQAAREVLKEKQTEHDFYQANVDSLSYLIKLQFSSPDNNANAAEMKTKHQANAEKLAEEIKARTETLNSAEATFKVRQEAIDQIASHLPFAVGLPGVNNAIVPFYNAQGALIDAETRAQKQEANLQLYNTLRPSDF